MLLVLLNSSLFLIDLFIKTFVLATCTYFFGNPLLTLAKHTIYTQKPLSLPTKTAVNHQDVISIKALNDTPRKTQNGSYSKATNGNEIDATSENTATATNATTGDTLVRLFEHNQSDTEPLLDDNEGLAMEKQEAADSPPSTDQPHASRTRQRLRTQSFPAHLTLSLQGIHSFNDSSQPTSSRSATCPPLTLRRESRVGQLVHRFEMNHRSEDFDICNPTSADIIDTPTSIMDPNHTAAKNINPMRTPLLYYSPKTPVSTTRAIDYRSIGFRPAITTWEKRITEGNPMLVPSKSRSSPVWCTRSQSSSTSR